MVVDATWVAESCAEELAKRAEAESALDPGTLQEIRVSAETITLERAQSTSPTVEDKDEVICVNEPRLGSLIPQQRCATRAQLEREAEEGREWVRTDGEFGGMREVQTIE